MHLPYKSSGHAPTELTEFVEVFKADFFSPKRFLVRTQFPGRRVGALLERWGGGGVTVGGGGGVVGDTGGGVGGGGRKRWEDIIYT